MNQADFVKDFLKLAFNLKEVDAPSISSCKSYFVGKTQGKGSEKRIIGDTIGAYFVKIIKANNNDTKTALNLQSLSNYLEDLITKSNAASQIVTSFRSEIPELDLNNVKGMAQKLAEFFECIIINTTDDYIKERLSNKGGDCAPISSQIIESDKCEIKKILKNLKNDLDELKGTLAVLEMTFMYNNPLNRLDLFSLHLLTNEQIEKLLYPVYSDSYNALNGLVKENYNLEFYCKLYPKIEELCDLFQIGNKIEFSDFCKIENGMPSFHISEQAKKYQELIEECIKQISQLQS